MANTLSYQLLADLDRDTLFANADSDLSAYVISQFSWNVGMGDGFNQEFAEPSTFSATLNNLDGVFSQDIVGSELISNGTFTNWTADDPNGWTVTGESGTNPQVKQVSAGGTHSTSGTGYANIYTTASAVSISQNVLTVGQRYAYSINFDTVTTGGLTLKSGGTTIAAYSTAGTKTGTFTATGSDFTIANTSACDVTIDSVSVKACPKYYNRLKKGVLLKLRSTYNGTTTTLWQGCIEAVDFFIGSYGNRTVMLRAHDPMRELLECDYTPQLLQNVTTDAALDDVFDSATLVYPYKHTYWVLEYAGYSELDTNTYLFNQAVTNFETGKTTMAYVGDNADKGHGVSAQAYLRDIVIAECGGRFWWDARNAQFAFHNRQHDLLNTTIDAAYTDTDVDSASYTYGKDVFNYVTVNYEPRAVGSSGSVLWVDDTVPYTLKVGETKKVTARYRDPNSKGSRVAGLNMLPLAAGTDFTATSANTTDPLNSDYSNRIGLSPVYNAQTAEITLNNYGYRNRDVTVTKLQVRGTPLTTFESTFVTAQDVQSQIDNSLIKKEFNIKLLQDQDTAQQFANYFVNRYSRPVGRVQQIVFTTSKNDSKMSNALTLTVGNKISFTDSWSGHSANYIIVGERHDVTVGEEYLHRCTWVLKLDARAVGWILEQVGRGELEQNTYLGF